ncbi:MAG TPA: type IV pilus biogenesis/stability protein PilW [Burkholderiaceae bacterium]|nr:type IV pilus biogenesis/stability protein PilW [Burkholderiaceae bacterium]
MKRATLALAITVLSVLGPLWGCTTTTTTTSASGDTQRERPTESDQTDADRRSRTRMELASGYYARGQLDVALDEIKLALQIKPDLPEAYNLRGLIYQSQGDDRLAEENFKRALQLNPRDADTMHNYGWFLCQSRRMPEAFAQFQQAIATPRYAGLSRTLMTQGVCQARTGALADAEKSLSRAYEIDPTSPVTAFNLADVLYRRGQYDRARFYIGRVNAVPEFTNAQTLWLAARIENKMGNQRGVRDYGRQLSNRFPDAPEAVAYQRGRFDD